MLEFLGLCSRGSLAVDADGGDVMRILNGGVLVLVDRLETGVDGMSDDSELSETGVCEDWFGVSGLIM